MRPLLRHAVLAIILGCAAPIATPVVAEPHPFRATLGGDNAQLVTLVRTKAQRGGTFKVIRLQSKKILGIGRARFVFTTRKLPAAQAVFVSSGRATKDLTVPTLMKGYALLNRGSGQSNRVSAALSVIKGEVQVHFSSAGSTEQARAPRLYSLTWQLSSAPVVSARVALKPNGALLNKLCSTHSPKRDTLHAALTTTTTIAPAKATTLARVVTLSTDADPEWFKVYGDSSNAVIAAIVNAAEAVFERQLGLRFALVRQHVYVDTSPYVSSDASVLLDSFTKNPENPANLGFSPLMFDETVDVKHLFTGKDLTGNVIGLSYVGAICWSPKNAYGLTQNISRDLNITTFLHEIGHTLGAGHDTSDVGGVMYPNLGIKRYFSPISVEQMNRTLATHGKCVSEEIVGANLANATLSIKQKRSKDRRSIVLTGTLLSNLAKPLPGELVKLTINKRVVFAMTDAEGTFIHRVKLSKIKTKQLHVFAQTVNNETAIPSAIRVPVRV